MFVHPLLTNSRIRAARGLSPADGHFLAGLLDAESSFAIRPNNGGQNWTCSVQVNVRDDDAELLLEFQELTGLGYLHAAAARRNSRPQVVWCIQNRLECSRLAMLLELYPLRGRKRLEVAVWTRAVRELGTSSRPPALPALANEIRSLRRYVNPSEMKATDHCLDGGLVAYLGGFFTGEGCLILSPSRCRTVLKLRDDDRDLLESLARSTGLGRVYSHPAYGRTRPSASWIVYRADQLRPMVRLLEDAGLRGRKQREFLAWREGALEFAAAVSARRRRARVLIEEASDDLKAARTYRPPSCPIVREASKERHVQAYLDVLRAAGQATNRTLTVGQYATLRSRNADWPDRNTIARAFGSWAAALDAAGLSDRCSPRARVARRYSPPVRAGIESRRRAAQARVLDAVWELARDLSRPPTIHEFLQRRAETDPSLPTLSTLYRIFPGGWSSVIDAASLPPAQGAADPG